MVGLYVGMWDCTVVLLVVLLFVGGGAVVLCCCIGLYLGGDVDPLPSVH